MRVDAKRREVCLACFAARRPREARQSIVVGSREARVLRSRAGRGPARTNTIKESYPSGGSRTLPTFRLSIENRPHTKSESLSCQLSRGARSTFVARTVLLPSWYAYRRPAPSKGRSNNSLGTARTAVDGRVRQGAQKHRYIYYSAGDAKIKSHVRRLL